MTTPRALLLAGAFLSLNLNAPAEVPAEARIEHLEQAARHLAELGMMEQAADLRFEAAEIRRDLRGGQIAELAAMIERLRRENHALRERLARLEARPRSDGDPATRASEPVEPPTVDRLAAEAHRRQTRETWSAIQRAARGQAPVDPAPAAPDPVPLLPPAVHAPEPTAPGAPALSSPAKVPPTGTPARLAPGDRALLEQILRTLQSIERNMGS